MSTTLAVVTGAAATALALFALVEPAAEALDTEPGLVEYTAFVLTWNLAVVALLVLVLPRLEGKPFRVLVTHWWVGMHRDEEVPQPRLLWGGIVVVAIVGLSPIRLWLVDVGWDLLPGPDWSINSPDANRGEPGFSIGTGVVVFQLLLRIPLTVFVEETLFRGWVQERHGPLVSGALFAGYHWAQWWTIGALLPFGVALSLLRVGIRSIWPGAVMHAAGNATYAFGLL